MSARRESASAALDPLHIQSATKDSPSGVSARYIVLCAGEKPWISVDCVRVGRGGYLRHLWGTDMIHDEILIAAALEIRATLQTKLSDMSTPTIALSRAEAILATSMIGALVGLISDEKSNRCLN